MTEQRKKGSKGAPRTELVATRFDPRTKYLLEVASRVQRRSVANYVEWAVGESFKNLPMPGSDQVLDQAGNDLWDVDAVHRLERLARLYPPLLTFEEQRLWKLCNEVIAGVVSNPPNEDPGRVLDRHWDLLTAAAESGRDTKEVIRQIQELEHPF